MGSSNFQNRLLFHYETLYVLRLNEECIDANIEQYSISKYPNLKDIFDIYIYQDKQINHLAQKKLVELDFGALRIIDFSPNKDRIEEELNHVRQSLKNYYESVGKTSEWLKSKGYDIIHEKSKKNLDVCSFSDLFYLYGRPFIKFIYRLGDIARIDAIPTEYDKPCWTVEFLHEGGFYITNASESGKERTIDQWLDFFTKDPEDSIKIKNKIVKQVEKIFGKNIQANDILFDPASQCYLFKEETEKNLLKELLPIHDVEQDIIAKYTTLETLVAMLQSNKIRMNSIVSMNDKTETDFLEERIKNYKEDYERDIDKYLFADKEFITSFTTKIDDLDMWRFYGDDAKGVCIVFSRKEKEKDRLYKINYVKQDAEILKQIDSFTNNLKTEGIKFHLWQLHKYCHFIKLSDYDTEDEYRLLESCNKPDGWFINRDNGILTPYIEKELKQTGNNDFPFHIDEIIIGPAMREKYANLMQVFYMICQQEGNISVSTSKIDSYR